MVVKVVDASAFAAVLFLEPEAEHVLDLLGDAELIAPALLTYELANVCLVKTRRNPQLADEIIAQFRILEHLLIELVAAPPSDVLDMARNSGLTAYDASYLWLSRTRGAELITLDRRLAAAAAVI